MSAPRHNRPPPPLREALFAGTQRRVVPHEFVLEALAGLSPRSRYMFGCVAVYVEDKMVLVLRDKRDQAVDNGVWLATTEMHH